MGTAGVTGAGLLVVLVLGPSHHLLSKFVFFFPWVAEAAGGRGSFEVTKGLGNPHQVSQMSPFICYMVADVLQVAMRLGVGSYDADCRSGRGHIHGRIPPKRKPIMQQCPSTAVAVFLWRRFRYGSEPCEGEWSHAGGMQQRFGVQLVGVWKNPQVTGLSFKTLGCRDTYRKPLVSGHLITSQGCGSTYIKPFWGNEFDDHQGCV